MSGYNKHLSAAALTYAIEQMLVRAGVARRNSLPVKVLYTDESPSGGGYLLVRPCSDGAWHKLLERPPHTMRWIPVAQWLPLDAHLPFAGPVPVLFGSARVEAGEQRPVEVDAQRNIVFHVDVLAAVLFMLSRWEEIVIPTRDEHDRFPATASVAYRQGFLDRPIVDAYALILREWLKVLLPRWQPREHSFSVKLSHDIDAIRYFRSFSTALRTLAGDLVKRLSPQQAWNSACHAVEQVVAPQESANYQGIGYLAELSLKYGFNNDAFYVMTTRPHMMESDYDYRSPHMVRVIEQLRKEGFEIGLHSGYASFGDVERLVEEKARMDALLGNEKYGVRQHYLRFRASDTWRDWADVGFTYDSTVGYADQPGFRCGTCHPFRPFDIIEDRELDIWEVPLIVMDVTLRNYLGLTPREGEQRIVELAHRCRQVGGVFTLLWHNTSLYETWSSWTPMYESVLKSLSEADGSGHSSAEFAE